MSLLANLIIYVIIVVRKIQIYMSVTGAILGTLFTSIFLQIDDPVVSVQQSTPTLTRAEAVMSLIFATTPDIPVIRNRGQFPDIPKGSWHEAFMLYAENQDIIDADPKTFNLYPEAAVTRAELLQLIGRTFNIVTGIPHRFVDVPSNAWYAPYAGIADGFHLFNVHGKTMLEPDKLVTKEEGLLAIDTIQRLTQENVQKLKLEQSIAQEQVQKNLSLYTVISTRRLKITLVDSITETFAKPFKRTIALPPTLPELRTHILTMINQERIRAGVHALTYNSELEQSAQGYADTMASQGFFGHVAPNGQTLKDRIRATNYYDPSYSADCNCVKGYALGENLARGQKTPKEAVEAWLKSPGHRKTLLDPSYTETGIGVKAGVWVEHFGGIILPN